MNFCQEKTSAGSMPRGKKGKLKKMEKYKDQDEAEKELRMQVLGVGFDSEAFLIHLFDFLAHGISIDLV
jgi:hypothetical protein